MKNHEALVTPAPNLHLEGEGYSWLERDEVEVPVVQVELPTGEAFLYGSLIGLSNSLTRMASGVSQADSNTLNTRLFSALPDILNGLPHANTKRIPESQHIEPTLFAATRHFAMHPFLLFGLNSASNGELPSVLRVGTGRAEDYPKCLSILGITTIESRRRKRT